MAGNDLELGAEWLARAGEATTPSPERMTELSEGWTDMRAAERASKAELDAAGHRALAEEREAQRREADERP